MFNPRQTKIFREMWVYKTRTVLVVLAIAVGVGVFGQMGASRIILERDRASEFAGSNPAHAVLSIAAFNDELVSKVASMDGVQSAEGRRLIYAKIETAPEQ